MVIGAGSTSFEIIRQTASTLLVQPIPVWMRSRVQPIAVADVLRTMADAVEGDGVGAVDVGGPDVVTYPELLALYAEVAGLPRVQVPVLGAPVTAVSLGAGLVSAAPYWTAAALVRSLRHDMVCRPGQPDPAVVDLTDALPLREALEQAVLADGRGGRAAGRERSDPAWVQSSWVERSIVATRLPGTTLLSSALHVADARVPGPPRRASAPVVQPVGQPGSSTSRQELDAVASSRPAASVSVASASTSRRPRLTTRPSQVTRPVLTLIPRRNFTFRSMLV